MELEKEIAVNTFESSQLASVAEMQPEADMGAVAVAAAVACDFMERPSLADLLDGSQDSSLAFKMLKHTRLVRAPNPNKNKTKSTSCLIFISILDQGHAVRLGSSMSGQQQQQSASGCSASEDTIKFLFIPERVLSTSQRVPHPRRARGQYQHGIFCWGGTRDC
ncbi:hypothetical protein O3P69_016444 [Scylla paramamosain]|uniref:Uncharacterized protein n=1 Tax=Scylla paramamosain TaxID=85552 RepID=A0AAW0TE83_SCYPA